jgi:hypothetical protein
MSGIVTSTASTLISGVTYPNSVPGGLSVGGPSTAYPTGGSGITSTSSSGLGLASLAGSLIGVLALLILLTFVAVFVIIVVANRADPDPSGRRPQSVYYFAVSFVTIGATILGSTLVVEALVQLIGQHSGSIANSVARASVIGGLITVISAFLLSAHLRPGLEAARSPQPETNPSRRVGQSYAAAVAFISVSTLLFSAILSIYLLFALAGPGVFGSFGGSTPTIRYLIVFLYLGGVSALVLWTHRDLVPPGLGFLGRSTGRSPGLAPGPVPEVGSFGP